MLRYRYAGQLWAPDKVFLGGKERAFYAVFYGNFILSSNPCNITQTKNTEER